MDRDRFNIYFKGVRHFAELYQGHDRDIQFKSERDFKK